MKKCIALLLSLILSLGMMLPAFALEEVNTEYPHIYLGGDGEAIYDRDGVRLWELDKREKETDFKGIVESVANVTYPLLFNGLLCGDFTPYYDAFEKEIAELFDALVLDENGEATNGSGVRQKSTEVTDYEQGQEFTAFQYRFLYDWRLDPWETADELDAYIDYVLEATGKTKVCLSGRCLGTSFITAYVAKYGYSKIHGFALDGAVCGGNDILSEIYTGRADLDAEATQRLLLDKGDIDELLAATLDLLIKSGVPGVLIDTFKSTLYEKLKKELTGRLVTSTFGTMPGYWTMINAEDYEEAKNWVFGGSDSEKYLKYSGLIEKLDRYHENVRLKISDILLDMKNAGVNICIVAKYGTQMNPFSKSAVDSVGDADVTLESSSFGATTAPSIYDTLSEEYIASQTEKGLGGYISCDKQVDASTCLLPDNTWFIKGVKHSFWTKAENDLIFRVMYSESDLDIHSAGVPQFVCIYGDDLGETFTPLTPENEKLVIKWETEPERDNPSFFGKIGVFLKSIKNWQGVLLNKFFGFIHVKLP